MSVSSDAVHSTSTAYKLAKQAVEEFQRVAQHAPATHRHKCRDAVDGARLALSKLQDVSCPLPSSPTQTSRSVDFLSYPAEQIFNLNLHNAAVGYSDARSRALRAGAGRLQSAPECSPGTAAGAAFCISMH